MAAVASSDLTSEQHSMRLMATHIASAMMSPVLQVLQQRDEAQQAAMRQTSAKINNVSHQLQRIESKLDSSASFYPLMALTNGAAQPPDTSLGAVLDCKLQKWCRQRKSVQPSC